MMETTPEGIKNWRNWIQHELKRITMFVIPPDCETDKFGQNYIVNLQDPEGKVIRLLIPVDATTYEGRGARLPREGNSLLSDDDAVGLNLVCRGHYT